MKTPITWDDVDYMSSSSDFEDVAEPLETEVLAVSNNEVEKYEPLATTTVEAYIASSDGVVSGDLIAANENKRVQSLQTSNGQDFGEAKSNEVNDSGPSALLAYSDKKYLMDTLLENASIEKPDSGPTARLAYSDKKDLVDALLDKASIEKQYDKDLCVSNSDNIMRDGGSIGSDHFWEIPKFGELDTPVDTLNNRYSTTVPTDFGEGVEVTQDGVDCNLLGAKVDDVLVMKETGSFDSESFEKISCNEHKEHETIESMISNGSESPIQQQDAEQDHHRFTSEPIMDTDADQRDQQLPIEHKPTSDFHRGDCSDCHDAEGHVITTSKVNENCDLLVKDTLQVDANLVSTPNHDVSARLVALIMQTDTAEMKKANLVLNANEPAMARNVPIDTSDEQNIDQHNNSAYKLKKDEIVMNKSQHSNTETVEEPQLLHTTFSDSTLTSPIDLTLHASSLDTPTSHSNSSSSVANVDCDKLFALLDNTMCWGSMLDGKDVVVLIGYSGAGKTTTLLHMAGVQFDEVEVDGCFHLEPTHYPDDALRAFRTGYGASSITDTVQGFMVKSEGHDDATATTTFICDGPGLNDTRSVEEEMAYKIGLLNAIRSARSVKPVVVIAVDSFGSRFDGLLRMLDEISCMTGGLDYSAFSYAFTKADGKRWKTRICKILEGLRKTVGNAEDKGRLAALLDDMIDKTSPYAVLVDPVDDDGQATLRLLLGDQQSRVVDTQSFFRWCLSEATANMLRVQLQRQVKMAAEQVESGKYDEAQTSVSVLLRFETILPEVAASFAQEGRCVGRSYAARCVKEIEDGLVRVLTLHMTDLETIVSITMCMKKQMLLLCQSESFCALCGVPDEHRVTAVVDMLLPLLQKAVEGSRVVDPDNDSIDAMDCFLSQQFAFTWHLTCLYGLKHALAGHSGYDDAVRSHSESLNRLTMLLKHVFAHATDLLRGVPQFDRYEQQLLFCVCVHIQQSIQQHCYTDDDEDWSWVGKGVKQMISEMDAIAVDHVATLSDALLRFEAWFAKDTEWTSVSFLDSKFSEILLSRNYLSAFVSKIDLISKISLERTATTKLIQDFDKFAVLYLCHVASSANKDADIFVEQDYEGCCSIEARKQTAKVMIDKLVQSCLVCKGFRDSCTFDQSTIDEPWQEMTKMIEFLKMYCNGLNKNAVGIVKDVKGAASASSEFLARLRSGTQPIFSMLAELSQPENYDCWTLVLSEEETAISRVIGFWQSMTGSKQVMTGSQQALNVLKMTLKKILVAFHSFIMNAFACVSDMIVPSIDGVETETPRLLKKLLSAEVLLCFETFKIESTSQLLTQIRKIEGACRFDDAFVKARQALEQGFSMLSKLPMELMQRRDFEFLGSVLDLWKNPICHDFWSHVRTFSSSVKSSTFCVNKAADMHSLVEQIDSCQSYEALCRESTKALCKVEKELVELTFENVLKYSSEIEQSKFSTHVVTLMIEADNARFLVDHVGTREVEKIKSLSQRCHKKLQDEIDAIGTKLLKLLSAFPNNEDKFDSISVLILNLKSIQKAFVNRKPEFSVVAEQFIARARGDAFGNLDKAKQLASVDTAERVHELLRLKRASRDITCWSQEINAVINKRLDMFARRSINPSRYIMDLSVLLRNEDGDRGSIAKQILAEHRCFDGAMNALFNEATSRQGIDDVLLKMHPRPDDTFRMEKMYNSYENKYKEIVQEGFLRQRKNGGSTLNQYLSGIVRNVKMLAVNFDFDFNYEKKVMLMAFNIFAFWSLKRSSGFAPIAETYEDTSPYLLHPHAAQVVAVWLLLNCKEKSHQRLCNQLVEVKTGEGKSVILAVTAIILALLDWDVSCVCYSEYLSTRDFKSFEDLFTAFGVQTSIWYGTTKNLTFKTLGNYCEFAKRSLRHDGALSCSSRPVRKPRVLLIDEVDVFFKEDFFGEIVRPSIRWNSELLLPYFLYLYDERPTSDSSHAEKLRSTAVNSLPLMWRPTIESMLLKGVQQVELFEKNFKDYEVVHGKIAHKYLDGYTTTTTYGLDTVFTYIKEHKAGRLTESEMKAGVELSIRVGQLSYAEYPFDYEVILGATGTLRGLEFTERHILQSRFGIKNYAYIPSVFGDNKLKSAADDPDDFVLCSDNNDYYLKLTNEIRNRRCARSGTKDVKRAVIVFLESKAAIEAFYSSSYMEQMGSEIQTVTEYVPPREKEAMFQKATEQGAISLMIREYGRGTDFKCYDSRMLQEGGVHVIQGFFSRDPSEEIQIMGRCARQGEDGSFSMVLNFEQLTRDFGLTQDDLQVIRSQQKPYSSYLATKSMYSFLATKRNNCFDKVVENLFVKVDAAEELHYRTLAYQNTIAVGNLNEESVEEFMRFISELNGCECYSTKSSKNLKDDMLKQRVARLEAKTAQDQKRWLDAQALRDKIGFLFNCCLFALIGGLCLLGEWMK